MLTYTITLSIFSKGKLLSAKHISCGHRVLYILLELGAFENRILRSTFEGKREEVGGETGEECVTEIPYPALFTIHC
jgi:hypothetical protein